MLPQKVKNELKKASQYVETKTDNNTTDYLKTTTEEYYNSLTMQNSHSNEEYILHLTEDEIEKHIKITIHIINRKPEGGQR